MCNQQHPSSLTDSDEDPAMLCTGYSTSPEADETPQQSPTWGPWGQDGRKPSPDQLD